MSKLSELLLITEEQNKSVKKEFEKTDEDIKQDVQILHEWWAKQLHLPQEKDNANTERILMRNKFRIEQTKKKLDAYYTLRGMYPEFFTADSFDIHGKTVQNALKCYYLFPLKAPGKNLERVYFVAIRDAKAVDYFSLLEMFQFFLILFEVVSKYDYCASIKFISDMKEFAFSYYIKMDPILLYKGMKIVQEGFSCRIAGIEYLNAPTFVDLIVKLVSPMLKEGRIRTHSSVDSLNDIIDVEHMPNEYGGKAGSLDEIQNAWIKEIGAQKDFLTDKLKCVSDESKRIGKSQYDDMFGSDGTFKKLNLD